MEIRGLLIIISSPPETRVGLTPGPSPREEGCTSYTDLIGQGICSAPSPFWGRPGWGHLAEDKVLTAPIVESMIKLLYTLPISAGGGVILFSSHHSISESSDVAM